jgi:hypothetical protein
MADRAKGETNHLAYSLPSKNLEEEQRSLHRGVIAFSKAASARAKIERQLENASTALAAVVSASIFASVSASPNTAAKVTVGTLSALAAGFSALEKLSTKAPSTGLGKRAGDYARLSYRLQLEGDSAIPSVFAEHAALIETPPFAGDEFWQQANTQIRYQQTPDNSRQDDNPDLASGHGSA